MIQKHHAQPPQPADVTRGQMEKINRHTRRAMTADEVYVFTMILCDNEIDRDGERFTEPALQTLAELFVGKTGLSDHVASADNQQARIFETAVVREPDRLTSFGDPYCCVRAWAYMARSAKTRDLILEIDAGIRREVSVSCSVRRVICSVCGADRKTSPCAHRKGEPYDGAVCHHLLDEPTDAFEWSFVAVPAQKNAGVTKGHKQQARPAPGAYTLEKLFDARGEENVTLTPAQLDALRKEYAALRELARVGDEQTQALRAEVKRLALLSGRVTQPDTLEEMVRKAAGAELVVLRDLFANAAAEHWPVRAQTAAPKQPAGDAGDDPYRI